ncbi:MAG: DUF2116 family Zn-ribbon domain-containing protein [Clostridia bacterium]|nr:DUF2116 family Zn-ribbon domain-containing protein [Clostridia bacterium]
MITKHTCPCGVSFLGGPRAKWCSNCRKEIAKERSRLNKRNGAARPIGSKDKCLICGNVYTVKSGLQKYCEKCAPSAILANDRKQGKEYYHKNRDNINRKKSIKRREKRKICIVCGKSFDPDGKPRKTCSEQCRRELRNQRWRESYYRKKGKT